MSDPASIEDLLRELAPLVLGAVARRYGDFAGSEDAVQEALIAAAQNWPSEGLPENPAGWLVRTAGLRLVDEYRRNDARRRREDIAAALSIRPVETGPATDDSLVVLFMCCHPSLTPAAAVPLTLRAVGGLTTREIAAALLVSESTMAQRISRAKATLRSSNEPFVLPADMELTDRLRLVYRVLYLMFNEGYAASSGPELTRTDLSGEAIRLTRLLHESLPDEPETGGLLALMLLTEARRPARTDDHGELVPLAEQDRTLWIRPLITEGVALITECLRQRQVGEFQVQAAIAAVHDQSATNEDANWVQILLLYEWLEHLTGNPMVTLNRAVALAMVDGPTAGLAALERLEGALGDHHRLHATRAHLHELAGDPALARRCFLDAAARADNQREQHYLTIRAARLTPHYDERGTAS